MKIDDKQEIGIGGFTVLARVRNVLTIESESPDTPLEDGSISNDHIILNPIKLEIQGRIGDLIIKPAADLSLFRRTITNVGVITSYSPGRTQTQIAKVSAILIDANNARLRISDAERKGQQLSEFFGDKTPEKTNIDNFLSTLELYRESKKPLRIEMPNRIYDDMVITSLVITWDNISDTAIEYKISTKQLRFADIIFADISDFRKEPSSGGVSDQVSGQESNGLNDAPEIDRSIVSSIVGIFQ